MVPHKKDKTAYGTVTVSNVVTPLIEAEEAFSALERACRSAQKTIHLCYRIIDPDFHLLEPLADDGAEDTWLDLLTERVRAGVSVRILMADFDEIVATDMHREAQRRYKAFLDIQQKLSEEERSRFQVHCVQHPARIGSVASLAAWPVTWKSFRNEVEMLNDKLQSEGRDTAEALLALTPELKRHVSFRPETERYECAFFPPHRVRPATHHEKLAILDSKICFVGGIDVCELTFDTADHDHDPAWHDIGYRIAGPAVAHAELYFAARWNDAASAPVTSDLSGGQLSGTEFQPEGDADPSAGRVRFVGTSSVGRKSPFARTPRPVVTEIRESVLKSVETARAFLYIENQFLRDIHLAQHIADQAGRNEDLTVVIVLPVVPDRSVADGEVDLAAAHGLALQDQALELLLDAFGERLGVFALARDEPHVEEELGTVAGSKQVYVHSKLMIVDDKAAIAGSANFNGRSFLCDSELAFEWEDPTEVRALRLRLWHQLLGAPEGFAAWGPKSFPANWRAIAEANEQARPQDRSGFVVPFPKRAVGELGKRHWLVPDMLV